MKITANFNKRLLNVSGVFGNTKSNINRALSESAQIVKSSLKAELRSPNKSGTVKTGRRSRFSPGRRSARGESLARETGRSEQLISSSRPSSSKVRVGFESNPSGFDYVEYQELSKNRPTMELAIKKSISKIERAFERNLTPK